MTQWGVTSLRIVDLLESVGPMTKKDVCVHLGIPRERVSSIFTRLSRPGKREPKRIYVHSYCYDQEGERLYPRAVYAAGDKRDAKSPGENRKASSLRSRARSRTLQKMSSVFNVASTRVQFADRKSKSTGNSK